MELLTERECDNPHGRTGIDRPSDPMLTNCVVPCRNTAIHDRISFPERMVKESAPFHFINMCTNSRKCCE